MLSQPHANLATTAGAPPAPRLPPSKLVKSISSHFKLLPQAHMDEVYATAAREKARRQHANTAETIPCYCDRCNGAQQLPRTVKLHEKSQRQRERAVGFPRAPIAGSSRGVRPLPAQSPGVRSALRDISNSPLAASSRLSSPRAPPSSPRPLDSPARSASLGRHHTSRSSVSISPFGSLRSSHPPSQRSSPGARGLLRNDLRDDGSNGNLSDLVRHEDINQYAPGPDYYQRLLDDLDKDEARDGIGFDGFDEEDQHSRDGSNDGLENDNFGLAGANEHQDDQQRFDFDEALEFDDGDDPDDAGDDEPLFAAFEEPDLIRNSYVDAFVQKSVFRATHRALNKQLRDSKRNLSANPTIAPEQLAKMAQTIGTAEKRLGISTSDVIQTYTLCPTCKRRYDPAYIAGADQNTCINIDCSGVLFTDKLLASGRRQRTSTVTYPVASLIAWLRRVFAQPGMAELMQNWRDGPDDDEEMSDPIPAENWMNNLDYNRPLVDISDGWEWRARRAGLQRVVNEDEDAEGGDLVSDHSVPDPPLRFSSLPFGLSLSMNTDWFQSTKEGNYSVGGCYFVINNLPRHLRFLRENICLATVLPGPNEPGDYALDQMMEPIAQELAELQTGVEIRIRKADPPRYEECLVHADLCHHIADLIARIKLGGGAGVASEMNFYFPYRDPHEDLQNAYFWKRLESNEDRQLFFEETGNRYTILHSLPGWHTASQSPPDSMHLLYLGGASWTLKQIIMGPNLLAPRRPDDVSPISIYNDFLEKDLWLPYSVVRLPPKLGQTNTRLKADQLRMMTRIMFVPLYLAMRDGDEISQVNVPRGSTSSTGGKHQLRRAKILHKLRIKHYTAIDQPDQIPTLAECFPSRNLPLHYKQILKFCLAVCILDVRSICPTMIRFGQSLLESACIAWTRMNVPLPPNFHYMQHLEEFMLRTGSLYNTHVWAMERANGIVSRINHNGRGSGVLEGTMMRAWWEHGALQSLIRRFQAIPNRNEHDNAIINDLLMALRGGPEHAHQRGALMAYVAQSRTAYARLHGIQESTRLSPHSRSFKLVDRQLYTLVVDHCNRVWPNAGIFGPGEIRQLYLPPEGAVRNFSYLEHDSVRYGSFLHTFGRRACYGYTNPRSPVRIERILYVEFPDRPAMRTICVVVRRFRAPRIEPVFPWSPWQTHFGAAAWEHEQLSDLVTIPASDFNGVFALMRVPMSHGTYWVTVSLNSLEPEEDREEIEHDEDDEWL